MRLAALLWLASCGTTAAPGRPDRSAAIDPPTEALGVPQLTEGAAGPEGTEIAPGLDAAATGSRQTEPNAAAGAAPGGEAATSEASRIEANVGAGPASGGDAAATVAPSGAAIRLARPGAWIRDAVLVLGSADLTSYRRGHNEIGTLMRLSDAAAAGLVDAAVRGQPPAGTTHPLEIAGFELVQAEPHAGGPLRFLWLRRDAMPGGGAFESGRAVATFRRCEPGGLLLLVEREPRTDWSEIERALADFEGRIDGCGGK
jgi:hypothetical protein